MSDTFWARATRPYIISTFKSGYGMTRQDYFYLTPQAKVNLERRISVSSLNFRPQISTKE